MIRRHSIVLLAALLGPPLEASTCATPQRVLQPAPILWNATFNAAFSAVPPNTGNGQSYLRYFDVVTNNVSTLPQTVSIRGKLDTATTIFFYIGGADLSSQIVFRRFDPTNLWNFASPYDSKTAATELQDDFVIDPGAFHDTGYLVDYLGPVASSSVIAKGTLRLIISICEARGAVGGAVSLNTGNRNGGIAFDQNIPAAMSSSRDVLNGGRPF